MLPRRRKWWPLGASICGHAVALLLLPIAAQWIAQFDSDEFDWSSYHVEPLHVLMPDPVVYTANDVVKPRPSAPAPRRRVERTSVTRIPAPPDIRTPHPAVALRIPKGFELPPVPERNTSLPMAVLQPEYRPNVQTAAIVPSLAYWARMVPSVPKAPPKQFIQPGRKEAPTTPAQLDAPPVLAVPNRQPNAADVNIALAQTEVPKPQLPMPNSTTVPVRDSTTQQSQGGVLDRNEGDPANLIAISPARVPPGQVVNIPRGLRSVPPTGNPDGAATPGSSGPAPAGPARNSEVKEATSSAPPRPDNATRAPTASSPARASDNASAKPTDSGTAKSPDAPAAKASDNPAGKATESSGKPAENATAKTAAAPPSKGPEVAAAMPGGNNSHSGSEPAKPPVPAPNPNPPAPASPLDAVVRVTHPSNGNFDVVITQSTPSSDAPDIAGLLTGNPVYTVYLVVGDQKEWLLEYCVPARDNRHDTYQVFIGEPAPVSPPYPLSTAIPNSILNQQHANIIFHGYLTAGGAFRDMVARDLSNPVARQIAALLGEWRFRPAAKDRVPTEIEIVLVVPARI